jgi:hypothetical protein
MGKGKDLVIGEQKICSMGWTEIYDRQFEAGSEIDEIQLLNYQL